jgi:hypothetical protein
VSGKKKTVSARSAWIKIQSIQIGLTPIADKMWNPGYYRMLRRRQPELSVLPMRLVGSEGQC